MSDTTRTDDDVSEILSEVEVVIGDRGALYVMSDFDGHHVVGTLDQLIDEIVDSRLKEKSLSAEEAAHFVESIEFLADRLRAGADRLERGVEAVLKQ